MNAEMAVPGRGCCGTPGGSMKPGGGATPGGGRSMGGGTPPGKGMGANCRGAPGTGCGGCGMKCGCLHSSAWRLGRLFGLL